MIKTALVLIFIVLFIPVVAFGAEGQAFKALQEQIDQLKIQLQNIQLIKAAYGQVTDGGTWLSGSDNWSCGAPVDLPHVRIFYVLLSDSIDPTHPPTCVVSADYDTYDQYPFMYMPFNVTQFKHSPVYDQEHTCWALEIGAAAANYETPPKMVPSTTGFSFVCVQ